MKTVAISATKAARNFAVCVNRAHHENVVFVLLKKGSPVAGLVTAVEKVCSGRDLACALSKARLCGEEAKAWRRDLRAARRALKG